LEITVSDYFYSDNKDERAATLVMGKQAVESYQDGDRYLKDDAICNDDPADTDCWLWTIGELTSNAAGDTTQGSGGPTLGVVSDWVITSDSADPVEAGECYAYPNDYASVCLDSLTVNDDDYITVKLDQVDSTNLKQAISTKLTVKTIHIQSSVADTLEVDATHLAGVSADVKTEDIWLEVNTTNKVNLYYMGTDGIKKYGGQLDPNGTALQFARINYGDTKANNINMTLLNNTASTAFNVSLMVTGKTTSDFTAGALGTGVDNIVTKWGVSSGFNSLGDTQASAESNELIWGSSLLGIGTKDENHRTYYGIVIEDPKSHGASEEVVLQIPNEEVFATVVVKGPGTVVTTSTGDAVKNVVPITTAVAKLDSEVSLPVEKHLVLVGGPGVNTLTAQAMGLTYPTYGASGLLPYGEGEGYISVAEDALEDGFVVVTVQGWSASDTRNAASVMQQYTTFADELADNDEVVVTSVSSAGITAVAEGNSTA
jgi:hypothetical protein